MDPRQVREIQQQFMAAIHALEVEYVELLQRMGCKRVTLYRF